MSSGILIDSCLFIDHMRARDKASTALARILYENTEIFISTIVEYEVKVGLMPSHQELWDSLRRRLQIFAFDSSMVLAACEIKRGLKTKGTQIDISDLFIAATAMVNDLSLATLNRKHFEQIDGLRLLLPVP